MRDALRASLSLALRTTSPRAATAGANELTREYTAATDAYYRYDGSGNTVAKQEASGTTYYQYDFENLMTRIDFGDDSHNYFGYDADSKRVEKVDSAGYARFVYQGPDMLKLLQEQDADGDAAVQYTMGGALEAMRRANGGGLSGGATSFYHFDWLGSPFALTDATAAATDTYLYDAWGEVLNRTGSATNPHTYIGKERYYRMPNASLYHLGFRDYAAGLGRFMTVDPKRDGVNWFAYTENAPTMAIDALGQDPIFSCESALQFRYWEDLFYAMHDAVNAAYPERDLRNCRSTMDRLGMWNLAVLARCIIYGETEGKDDPTMRGDDNDLGLFQITPAWTQACGEVVDPCFFQDPRIWQNPYRNMKCGMWLLCSRLGLADDSLEVVAGTFRGIRTTAFRECIECFREKGIYDGPERSRPV